MDAPCPFRTESQQPVLKKIRNAGFSNFRPIWYMVPRWWHRWQLEKNIDTVLKKYSAYQAMRLRWNPKPNWAKLVALQKEDVDPGKQGQAVFNIDGPDAAGRIWSLWNQQFCKSRACAAVITAATGAAKPTMASALHTLLTEITAAGMFRITAFIWWSRRVSYLRETELLTPTQRLNEYIMTSLQNCGRSEPGLCGHHFNERNAVQLKKQRDTKWLKYRKIVWIGRQTGIEQWRKIICRQDCWDLFFNDDGFVFLICFYSLPQYWVRQSSAIIQQGWYLKREWHYLYIKLVQNLYEFLSISLNLPLLAGFSIKFYKWFQQWAFPRHYLLINGMYGNGWHDLRPPCSFQAGLLLPRTLADHISKLRLRLCKE